MQICASHMLEATCDTPASASPPSLPPLFFQHLYSSSVRLWGGGTEVKTPFPGRVRGPREHCVGLAAFLLGQSENPVLGEPKNWPGLVGRAEAVDHAVSAFVIFHTPPAWALVCVSGCDVVRVPMAVECVPHRAAAGHPSRTGPRQLRAARDARLCSDLPQEPVLLGGAGCY